MVKKTSTAMPEAQVERREPAQARSREMIRSIIEAAQRVLRREGWSGFTTNRVAKTAGVSVGSLYQYFANKDDLAIALIDNRYGKLQKQFACELEKALLAKSPDAISILVHTFIEALDADGGLYFKMKEELSGAAKERLAKVLDDVIQLIESLFAANKEVLGPNLTWATAFVLAGTVEGTLAAAYRRKMPRVERQIIQKELASLITFYLQGR